MRIGRPAFVPVMDLEMGFEKIVRIAHARGGKVLYLKTRGGNFNHLVMNGSIWVVSDLNSFYE